MTLDTYMLTETASTKRPPALVSGKRGEPVTHLSSVRCMPLFPVDADTKHRAELRTASKVWGTFVDENADIEEGDTFIKNSVSYPVIKVEPWSFSGFTFRQLYLEELKR